MSEKSGGQGKNQSAPQEKLDIPTLGAAKPQPLRQPGEEDENEGGHASASFDNGSMPQGANMVCEQSTAPPPPRAPEQQTITSPGGITLTPADIAAIAAQVMGAMAPMLAKNNPVVRRGDQEQFAEARNHILDMPVEGDIDTMRRPDQREDARDIDIDVFKNMDHAAQLLFMEELVTIQIHDTGDEQQEQLVPVFCNGRSQYLPRGKDITIKRYFVERLLRAKPENVKTRLTRTVEGDIRNHIDKTRSLKYPFSIVRDTPKGLVWAKRIRAEP